MENKNYLVYGLLIRKGKETFIYVGSGDTHEPTRRKYDFLKGHCINKKAKQKLNNNFWSAKPVIIYTGLSKKASLGVENELIGILQSEHLLNRNKARKNGSYNELKHDVLRYAVNTIEIASWAGGLDAKLLKNFDINDDLFEFYKMVNIIVTQKSLSIN